MSSVKWSGRAFFSLHLSAPPFICHHFEPGVKAVAAMWTEQTEDRCLVRHVWQRSVMTGPGLFSKHGPVLVYATANYLHQITLFPPFAPQHVCLLHVCFLAFNKSHLNVVQENGIISCTTIGCAAAETYLRKMSHNLDNDSCEWDDDFR